MKLKRFKFKQILKLHLLNSRVYEHVVKKDNTGLLTEFNITETIGNFKRILHVIFKYHKANKRILFVGLPKALELKINRLTQHVAVNCTLELQGVILEGFSSSKLFKTKKSSSDDVRSRDLLTSKLSKKPDLVVIVAHQRKQNIIAESNVAKIPTIVFNSVESSKGDPIKNKGSYNLQGFEGSSDTMSDGSLFFLGLNFLFKRLKGRSK